MKNSFVSWGFGIESGGKDTSRGAGVAAGVSVALGEAEGWRGGGLADGGVVVLAGGGAEDEPGERRERGEGAGGAGERPGAARHPRGRALPPADGDGFGLPGGGFFAAGEAELGEDLGDVVLGGGETDVEALGDLFVGEAFAEEVEDLPFARGEDVGMGRAAAAASGAFGGHCEISVGLVWGNYTSRLRDSCQLSAVSCRVVRRARTGWDSARSFDTSG